MSSTKRNVLLVALSLILVATCSFGLFTYKKNNVSAIGNLVFDQQVEIADEYTYGDKVNIPNSAEIAIEDNTYDSFNAVLIAPDGSVNKMGAITLDQIGYYTARYYYEDADGVKYEQIKFLVAEEKYGTSSENSSAEYISDLSDTANSQTYMFEDYASANVKAENGIKINDAIRVTLNETDTFTYNKPIRLNEVGNTNLITFANHFGIVSPEPLRDSEGNMLYDLYELNANPERYYETNPDGTFVAGTDGPDGNKKWKEDAIIPYMYEDNYLGTYTMYIRLTDAYDENNYVEIKVRSTVWNEEWNHDVQVGEINRYQDLSVGFNGGKSYGFYNKNLGSADSPDRPNVSWNGDTYELHCVSEYFFTRYKDGSNNCQQNRNNTLVSYDGQGVPFNGSNENAWVDKGENLFSQKRHYITLKYDASNMVLSYTSNNLSSDSGSVIMDLSLAEAFDGKAFKGFTTDEVYISSYVREMSTPTIYTDIVDIAGQNIDENSTAFVKVVKDNEGNVVETLRNIDTEAPHLEVNFTPSYAGRVYAAQNCEFPIFEASAKDVNLDKVISEVYYNYVDENNKGTLIYSDGKTFTPKQSGIYTIVYTALDKFGNTATETVEVLCVQSPTGKLLNLNLSQSDFDALSARAGETINLPAIADKISGLNGGVKYDVKAVYVASAQEIEIYDDHFTPLYAGAWQVVYTLEDSITSQTYTFNLTVASSDIVGYEGAPTLPKYLIGGAKYSLEDFAFYTFANAEGRTEVEPTISISYDGGTTYSVFNDADTIDGSKTSAILKYESGATAFVSAPIEIVDVGYNENINTSNPFVEDDPSTPDVDESYGWDIRKYFKTQNVEIITTKTEAIFKATQTSGVARFDFIKELSASNFKIEMKSTVDDASTTGVNEASGTNFGSFNITLTDYYDPSIAVEINLVIAGGETQLIVDGIMGAVKTTTILSDRTSTLRYSATNRTFYLGDATIVYELPFTSDKVYASFEIADIKGEAGIAITTLVNQKLGNLRRDNTNTMIAFSYDRGNKKLGDLFEINVPNVIDVLSPVLEQDVKVKITSPSGANVMSIDNVNLSVETLANRSYTIKLEEFGDYVISFIYKDQLATNNLAYTRTLTVSETEAPEITFKDGSKIGITIDVPVGRPVVLKSAKVFDNVDTNPRLTVFVGDKHLNLTIITLNSKGQRVFTPLEAGLYRITYRATDATGNSSLAYYYLNVK